MIPATLHPPSEPLEVALHRARALIAASRAESARIIAHTRKRATRYREKVKERAYRAGLQQGHAASALQCARMIESLRDLHTATIETAHQDAGLVAYRIIEELIEEHIRERPELITSWITRAIEQIKQTSDMTLRYHPRYEETLKHIASHLPTGITTLVDPTLGEIDFAIRTNIGAITFSWRELLQRLKATTPHERSV